MKRLLAPLLLLIGVLCAYHNYRVLVEVRKSPFGSEFLSVAYPAPLSYRLFALAAVACFGVAIGLIVRHVVVWIERRSSS